MRIDLHRLQTAESTDGITGGRYPSGLRCVNSSAKLLNSEFMAWSKTAASISAGMVARLVLNGGACRCRGRVGPTCLARELRPDLASEDREARRTAAGAPTPTSSSRRRFFSLTTCCGPVGVFSFAYIEACITGSAGTNEARFVCPRMVLVQSSTDSAANLLANASEQGVRDILRRRQPRSGRVNEEGARSSERTCGHLTSCSSCFLRASPIVAMLAR